MRRKKVEAKVGRKRFSAEFKQQTLLRAGHLVNRKTH